MKIPRGLVTIIANRVGIKPQNVHRSINSGNQKTIQAAKEVLEAMVFDAKELERLTTELSTMKTKTRKRVKPVQQKPGKLWYSVQETAEALSISTDTVIRRIKGQGKVKWDSDLVVQQGRVWRINQAIILNGGK